MYDSSTQYLNYKYEEGYNQALNITKGHDCLFTYMRGYDYSTKSEGV